MMNFLPATTLFINFWIILSLTVNILLKTSEGFVNPEQLDGRKCKYDRWDKMSKVRCYDMHLKEVPQYLMKSVEIMDLTFNRIKRLNKSSFTRYKGLRFLLLYENVIRSVEPGTFESLTSLEEIDLSNNALTTIPLELFNLPSLRNLYIDSNDLINLDRDLRDLQKPIKAPLEYLNVADCALHDIPYLGILPSLSHLNISMNPLDNITVENFSPMCFLKSVDLKRTEIPACDCPILLKYLEEQHVRTSFQFDCDITSLQLCPDKSNITLPTEEYSMCTNLRATEKAKSFWIMIIIGSGSFCLLMLLIFYCLHKGNSSKSSKIKKNNSIKLESITQNEQPLMKPL